MDQMIDDDDDGNDVFNGDESEMESGGWGNRRINPFVFLQLERYSIIWAWQRDSSFIVVFHCHYRILICSTPLTKLGK